MLTLGGFGWSSYAAMGFLSEMVRDGNGTHDGIALWPLARITYEGCAAQQTRAARTARAAQDVQMCRCDSARVIQHRASPGGLSCDSYSIRGVRSGRAASCSRCTRFCSSTSSSAGSSGPPPPPPTSPPHVLVHHSPPRTRACARSRVRKRACVRACVCASVAYVRAC